MLLKCLRNLLLLLLEQLLVQTFKSFSWAAAPSPALISLIYLIRSTDLEFLSLFRGVRDTLVSIFCHLGSSSPGGFPQTRLLSTLLTWLDAWKKSQHAVQLKPILAKNKQTKSTGCPVKANPCHLYVQSFSLLPLCHQSNSLPSLPSLKRMRIIGRQFRAIGMTF